MRFFQGLFILSIAASATVLVDPGSALAQNKTPREQARTHTEAGRKYQTLGDFEKAIVEYQHAYDLVPHPQLLFNLAQAYRLKGDKKKALSIYEKFVSIETSGSASTKAKGFIVVLKEAIAAEAAQPVVTPPKPITAPVVTPPVTPPVVTARPTVTTPPGPVTTSRPPVPIVSPMPAVSNPAESSQATPTAQETAGPLGVAGPRVSVALAYASYAYDEAGGMAPPPINGFGAALSAGYEFVFGSIGVRPSLRFEYYSLEDQNAPDFSASFFHVGAEVRFRALVAKQFIPFIGVGVGNTTFTEKFDFGSGQDDEQSYSAPGAQVTGGAEILVHKHVAVGATILLHIGDDSIRGGGLTLSYY